MKIKLFGETWKIVSKALQLRLEEHDVIASNIANVDTPGYQKKEFPFEKIMQAYLKGEPRLETTHPRHFSTAPEGEPMLTEDDWLSPEEGTPNNVSLEEEMSKLAENAILYQSTIQGLIKQLEILKEAITEGGRQ